jgi:hypothetical protein
VGRPGLAGRYARDFTVHQLAGDLWAVMEASPQDRHNPWRRHHAVDIAARAHQFIMNADSREYEMLVRSGAYAWAMSTISRPTVAGFAAAWKAAR